MSKPGIIEGCGALRFDTMLLMRDKCYNNASAHLTHSTGYFQSHSQIQHSKLSGLCQSHYSVPYKGSILCKNLHSYAANMYLVEISEWHERNTPTTPSRRSNQPDLSTASRLQL